MEKRWKNLRVDLRRLAQTIESSFSRRNLKVETTSLGDGYSIRVVLTALRARGVMDIIIRGTPDDFAIETRATEHEDKAIKLGLLTTPFGGGSLLLGSIKAREQLEKLEHEFWSKIEETIISLTSPRELRA
jgi:hypothetical protein